VTPIITGTVQLTDNARAVMQDILRACDIETLRCTDGPRSIEQQAAIMYKQAVDRGEAAQYKLYGPIGDQIIDVFVKMKGYAPNEILAAMRSRIRSIGPFKVSHHCCCESDSNVDVYDFAPSSIPKAKHAAFEKALSENKLVSKWIGPPKDLAYHIEILKA